MNPAKLDRRITFQNKTSDTDDEGIVSESWTNYVTVWAAREPLKGREFFAAAAANAENTVRYKIRYRSDVHSSMRLVDGGRIYSIIAPPEDVYGDHILHVMTQEVLLNG